MKRKFYTPASLISLLGLSALISAYAIWLAGSSAPLFGKLSAALSASLFAALCLRFVPLWTGFWSREAVLKPSHDCGYEPRHAAVRIFLSLLLIDVIVLLAVFAVRRCLGLEASFLGSLEFWRCADSQHYLNIAREWYLSEGSVDRLVELVFFPGYPLAVRFISLLVKNELYAGLIVSGVCFALSGTMLYRLARLDCPHDEAVRAVKYLCLLPGSVFFAAPMSESLFLLLSLLCIYLARTGKWTLGCIFGALSSFTRSLGGLLLVPLCMELFHMAAKGERRSLTLRRACSMLIVPLGTAAYLLINYRVSGDALRFMQYQHNHWGQGFGWFFSTASYQLENALSGAYSITTVLGLWLPNLVCSFGSLIIMTAGAKRLRPSYTAHFIAYFFVAIGATWLLSAPRYLAAMQSLPLALAALTRSRRLDGALTLFFAAFWAYYLAAFALRWQVW